MKSNKEVKRDDDYDEPVRLAVGDSAILDVLGVNDVRQVEITRTSRRPVCHTGPVEIVDDAGCVCHQRDGHERKPHAT